MAPASFLIEPCPATGSDRRRPFKHKKDLWENKRIDVPGSNTAGIGDQPNASLSNNGYALHVMIIPSA